MDKIKIGVLGAFRGIVQANYAKIADNAELVAVCDKSEYMLNRTKEAIGLDSVTYYSDFDEFIKHDMDAVVLANYANDHAPFAIKALKAGKHVYCEVLPAANMKEAVELIEAVEKSGLTYAYGENYAFSAVAYEMRRLYKAGKIGEFEYGECEYIHNCEPMWPDLTYGDPQHWRNNDYCTNYCTHSLGPIIHMTGLRPIRVTGFEGSKTERQLRVGARSGAFGMEMVELENGGLVKSIHGGLYKDSTWFSIYGSHGRMETAREDADVEGFFTHLYVNADRFSGEYAKGLHNDYLDGGKSDGDGSKWGLYDYHPKIKVDIEGAEDHLLDGHGGGDFFSMYFFVRYLQGHDDGDIIDIYEALDMWLPGHFAYRSILDGGVPKEIPNLRKKRQREMWRNDTSCTLPEKAGDMLWPSFSKGNPDIPEAVYARMRDTYEGKKVRWARTAAEKKAKEAEAKNKK